MNGIFLVRKNRSGACFASHVQYCPNGNPPVMACQVKSCHEVMSTASRSGLQGYSCSHIQSVPFLPRQVPPQRQLSVESLETLIDKLVLKPARRDQCLAYQNAANMKGVPLIIQLEGTEHSSYRYKNFSVCLDDSRKKWWSFAGRVCVTFDSVNHVWHCKHVKGSQSCIHKTIVKWYMAETNQFPFVAFDSVDEGLDESSDDETIAQTSDYENDVENDENMVAKGSSTSLPRQYPPSANCAEKMCTYIYHNKKIPPDVPIGLLYFAKRNETKLYLTKLYFAKL